MSDQQQPRALATQRMPSIACANHCTVDDLGVEWTGLVAALNAYVNTIFAPVWGTFAKIVDCGTSLPIPPECWQLVLLDDTDRQQYLGYHDLTPEGLPLAKIFVRDILDHKGSVSVTASHELAEMLVDPGIHLGARGPTEDSWYAYEVSDAVENDEFPVGDVAVSNFVYPAWFEPFRAPGSTKFDYMGTCGKPFEIRPGGFMLVFKGGKWVQEPEPDPTATPFNAATHPRVTMRNQPGRRLSNHGGGTASK